MLWDEVQSSEDILFFVAFQPVGAAAEQWYLAQVDPLATKEDTALRQGRFHMRSWQPHFLDMQTGPTVDCRFWTDIREQWADGFLGKHRPERPHKAEAALEKDATLAWYQLPLRLNTARLHGPFDFTMVRTWRGTDSNRIAQEDWSALEAAAALRGIPTQGIRDKPRRGRRRGVHNGVPIVPSTTGGTGTVPSRDMGWQRGQSAAPTGP